MSDSESLEKLLLPSRWSKRYPPDQILEKHLEFVSAASDKARQSIPSTLNVSYGPLQREKLDIFGTDLSPDAPIAVFIHGGYWQEESLTRCTYHFIASTLHKNGIKSIFLGYELCPNVTLAQIIDEIRVATKKCLDHAKDSRGVFLLGYSAGAHLAITTLPDAPKNVKGAILLAGIYDLTQLPRTTINTALGLSEEDAVKLSPLKQDLSGVGAPVLTIAAENDSPEFVKQARLLHEKLTGAGKNSTLVVASNVDHFDVSELLAKEDFEITKRIIDFINKNV